MAGQGSRRRGVRGPNAERRASTHQKILAATVRYLNEVGYAQTSTVRVAAEAKVARGSLLHQFPTRIDLILAVANHAREAHRTFMNDGLAKLPRGKERFVGSVDVTWDALQLPESRALLEIIMATRYDPELASRIPAFASEFEAGVTRGAHAFAEAMGLRDDRGEAAAFRRLVLVALRGLVIETMLSGADAEPDSVIALLRRWRAQFYDENRIAEEERAP